MGWRQVGAGRSVSCCVVVDAAIPIPCNLCRAGAARVTRAMRHVSPLLSFSCARALQKFARSIGAYDASTFNHTGGCDEALCDKIGAGIVLKVDLNGDNMMSKDPALLAKFCEALKSATCRVTDLK